MCRKFSYGRNNFQKLILILDPDTLTDMVSIMVNKIEYKPSVKDIMDKYYEMFRVKNSPNKKKIFNSPDNPDHSEQDSDTDG